VAQGGIPENVSREAPAEEKKKDKDKDKEMLSSGEDAPRVEHQSPSGGISTVDRRRTGMTPLLDAAAL
jgi:hypothetical protein